MGDDDERDCRSSHRRAVLTAPARISGQKMVMWLEFRELRVD